MPTASPRLPLVLLLLTAACILAGGLHLSRREQSVRLPQNRALLSRFASELMRELRRLEDLHVSHLERLSQQVDAENATRAQKDCEALAGVAECSFLVWGVNKSERYVRTSQVPYGKYPRPTFEPPLFNSADFIVFDPLRFFSKTDISTGWVDEPGKPLFFWKQRSDKLMVLLTIAPDEVQAAMTSWIRSWLQDHPAPSGNTGAEVELYAPDGSPLLQGSVFRQNDVPPHWSQPLPTRYGTWNLSSWDKVETHFTYHMPTLMMASSLAAIVALLGGLVFFQQQRAHRLAAQRVSFVNRVSHELRTPLTNMMLNLDVAEELLPLDDSESVSRLTLVREEAARLARLIENVLTFSRQEQGTLKLHTTECQPRKVVDATMAQFATALDRRGIQITRQHTGDDISSPLDGDALAQITSNLLSNVEKYAPGASVEIVTRQCQERFHLRVRDHGPGVEATQREHIFEPFARADDRVSAGVTGTGLGLSIARELAQRMGGRLWLEEDATDGQGACFAVEIPLTSKPHNHVSVTPPFHDSPSR